jgi:antitoxin HicB
MKGYAVEIEKDGSGYVATFPDVPEALTGGDTRPETLEMAQDALFAAIQGYME